MRTSDQELKYNAKDAAATRLIYDAVSSDVNSQGYKDTYEHTVALFAPLQYMMVRGVRVDHDALNELKKKCEVDIATFQRELNEIAGRTLNPNSPKDLIKYFYGEKGVAPYTKKNGKGGSSITCDDKALQRLAKGTSSRAGFKEAKLIQRIRGLSKLKGTYLDIIFDKDGRLRCSYNPRGTRFGRLSSSKTIFSTGMNMQNLPPAFQRFLVADPGKLLMKFDKRQAEWVVVAYASGDASMINAIESGLDTHAYTASQMFGIPIDIIKKEHKLIEHESDPQAIALARAQMDFLRPYKDKWMPRTTSMRQCGKKSNHALNYDETARMFSFINEITEKEAQVIIDFYHRIYPGIRSWHGFIRNKLNSDRTLENCFGRRYRFLERWGPDLFKSAYSYIPQSTVGELVNRGMVDIYHDSSPATTGLEIMQQVHDDIKLQMDYSDPRKLVSAIRVVQRCLNPELRSGGRTFHIATDAKVGFAMDPMEEIDINSTDEVLLEQLTEYLKENVQAEIV